MERRVKGQSGRAVEGRVKGQSGRAVEGRVKGQSGRQVEGQAKGQSGRAVEGRVKRQVKGHIEGQTECPVKLKLCFIRHGKTASNEARKYIGRTDEPLSEKGKQGLEEGLQDRICGDWMAGEADLLFSGPMRRCRETAEILFAGRDPIVIPEWTEIDFGSFEGKSFEELKGDPQYQAWMESGGRMPFPQGEGREAFVARSMRGYARMLRYVREHVAETERIHQIQGRGGLYVAAVVHGGTIMAVCSSLFGGDYYDYRIECGGGYVCPSIFI